MNPAFDFYVFDHFLVSDLVKKSLCLEDGNSFGWSLEDKCHSMCLCYGAASATV